MKPQLPPELEKARVSTGMLASTSTMGWNGAFILRRNGLNFCLIISNGLGWEHASVSIQNLHRCPTWEEMCIIKDLIWDHEETVMQLHPPKSQYINNHPYVLHLWKPTNAQIPTPPTIMVGVK